MSVCFFAVFIMVLGARKILLIYSFVYVYTQQLFAHLFAVLLYTLILIRRILSFFSCRPICVCVFKIAITTSPREIIEKTETDSRGDMLIKQEAGYYNTVQGGPKK